MQILIQVRWLVLSAALVCGLLTTLPWVYPAAMYWGVSFDWAFPGAAFLQVLGVFAMARAGAKRLWVIVGYVAAVAWAIAYAAATVGVAQGAGGLVVGIFVMLPANAVAILTQIASFIGFVVSRKSYTNPSPG